MKNQLGITEPTRDWFPVSLIGAFTDFADLVHGPGAEWGQLSCGCHPNCGVGTVLMINKKNKEWAPIPQFLDVPGLTRDLQKITDAARGKWFSNFMAGLAVLKHFNPDGAPLSLGLLDLLRSLDLVFAVRGEEKSKKLYGNTGPDRTLDDTLKRRSYPWNMLVIGGMWFQDLFNYDFRRTEMCIIPYATQQGEISFCAYNTGVGWRKIIENMHKNATVAEWYRTHGKHEIYAKGKKVELDSTEHSLQVNVEDASRARVRVSDGPMTAADEEKARRKAAWEAQEARRLYEELVLKKPKLELVQIGSPLGCGEPAPEKARVTEAEEVPA